MREHRSLLLTPCRFPRSQEIDDRATGGPSTGTLSWAGRAVACGEQGLWGLSRARDPAWLLPTREAWQVCPSGVKRNCTSLGLLTGVNKIMQCLTSCTKCRLLLFGLLAGAFLQSTNHRRSPCDVLGTFQVKMKQHLSAVC